MWVRPVDFATDITELTGLLHRAYRELALDTSEGADHLIRYYRRRGYREVERVDWGINYNSVILSKTLRENGT